MNKTTLSERDICTKFITPVLVKAGWDVQKQVRKEVNLTKRKGIVSGRVHRRGEAKRADYLPHPKTNLPLAIIEAKDNNHTFGEEMRQALPPLTEQRRIVDRVKELPRWCDKLKKQLHQTRALGVLLLDSSLHHLLAA